MKNVLSPEICEHFVKAMKGKTAPLRPNTFWKSQRCTVVSDKLAKWIFERMKPAVQNLIINVEADASRQHLQGEAPGDCPEAFQLGSDLVGVWKPVGFNETLRFAKYDLGDYFRKHVDAMYLRSEGERTLFFLHILSQRP